jgi:hypothetical protein
MAVVFFITRPHVAERSMVSRTREAPMTKAGSYTLRKP